MWAGVGLGRGSYTRAWTKDCDRAVCERAGGHKEPVTGVGEDGCCWELYRHHVPASSHARHACCSRKHCVSR